jgi:hypothetical protein
VFSAREEKEKKRRKRKRKRKNNAIPLTALYTKKKVYNKINSKVILF